MYNYTLLSIALSILLISCSTSDAPPDRTEQVSSAVTLTEGTNVSAAVSPDNETIAFSLHGRVWTMPADGGEATPITEAVDECHEPAWSPGGDRLAFYCYGSGTFDIWTSDEEGQGLRQVTSGASDDREPTWSPNGETIVFSSDRAGNYDIWQVALSTSELEQVTHHEAEDYSPSISPGGSRIAFASERERKGIYVADGADVFLTAPYSQKVEAPSWRPTGDELVFVGYDGQSSRLYRSDYREESVEELEDYEEDIFPFKPSWIDENSFIYTADGKIKKRGIGDGSVDTIEYQAEIDVKKSEYEKSSGILDDEKRGEVKGIAGPNVSPGGDKVAFAALGDIYVKTIGGGTTNVTDDPHVDIDPDWSPDGSKLAFVSDRGGRMQVWIRDMNSGEVRLLTEAPESGVIAPAWSPDGERIAFFTTDHRNAWGHSVLHVADVSTGEVTALQDPIFSPGKPSWSPDGSYIATMVLDPNSSRFREGINKFLVVSVEGGSARYVSPDSQTLGMRTKNGPIWSPDGDRMAYVQEGVVKTVPVRDNGEVAGPSSQITSHLSSNISWTGDSETIVYLHNGTLRKVDVDSRGSTKIETDIEWKREANTEKYVLHAGRVFTGVDRTYLRNIDILIEGNRIREVRKHEEHDEEVDVVDATGKVVMPGLFDMHTHLHNSADVKLGRVFLSYGITSVRETGADPYDALERKESWSSGQRPGPRDFFTGGLMDGSRVYYGLANSIAGKDHLDMVLQRAEELDYDLLKTYVRMPDARQKKIVNAAHEMGIPVSSHEIYPAAKFGADATEHLSGTSRLGYSPKLSNLNNVYGDVIDILSGAEMNITPTMVMYGGYLRMAVKEPSLVDHAQINGCYRDEYPQQYRKRAADLRASDEMPGNNIESLQRAVTEMANSEGQVTAGTDVPFLPFGSSLHAEVWLYEEGGLTPFQALQTATINAARAVGVEEELGSIEEGKIADFIVVDGDPLHDVRETLQVERVAKGGNLYDVDELVANCR